MSVLINRRTYTEINTQTSTLKNNLNIGIFQGSVMSLILYLIYSLDITSITHETNHKDNYCESKCKNPIIEIYIDDTYGTLEDNNNDIWEKVKKYIKKVNEYYVNDKLINNISKTNVMIVSKNQDTKSKIIKIDENEIKHSKTTKNIRNNLQ